MAGKRDSENEARLRRERLASRRSDLSETGGPAQYGPGPIDVHEGIANVPFANLIARKLHDRGIVNRTDSKSPFLEAEAAKARREEMRQRDAEEKEEAKRVARQLLNRGRPGGSDRPGPSMSDQAAAQAKQMRNRNAASDEAAAQNIERRQGITQKAGVQIDRKRVEYTPETQVGNISIARGRQVTEREEMGAGAKDRGAGAALRQQRFEGQLNRQRRTGAKPGGGGGVSPQQAMNLAKKNPYAMAATTALSGLQGNFSTAELGQSFGRGCVRSLWSSLWLTFGHAVYFLAIIFFLSWSSKFARRYLPQIGEEWFPAELLKIIPKAVLIPLKLAELIGIMFVLFWVLLLDITCIGLFALMLGIILSAAGAV